MIDAATKGRLIVSTLSNVGPLIMLPYSQIDELCAILDRHRICYSVQENVISRNGGPEIATVNLDRDADARAIQAILDDAR